MSYNVKYEVIEDQILIKLAKNEDEIEDVVQFHFKHFLKGKFIEHINKNLMNNIEFCQFI